MADRTGYISMKEAARQLGVTRATLHYYIKTMHLEPPQKFRLDKNRYLKYSDFEQIKMLRDEARERSEQQVREESVA